MGDFLFPSIRLKLRRKFNEDVFSEIVWNKCSYVSGYDGLTEWVK